MRRTVILVQLPIPPLGPDPIRGNVPLAAAYLKLFAESRGLASAYDIQLFPSVMANLLGDRTLAAALAEMRPWIVGFTCYLWNIERTLWIAHRLKELWPEVRIVLGGPEITPDNAWVLDTPDYDYAVIGEGEQSMADLLQALVAGEVAPRTIPGVYVPPAGAGPRYDPARRPAFRTPIADLNQLGSPYPAGILNAADEQMLLLETTRGCVFKCKFCYYPKSYDRQYYLDYDVIRANLRHANEHGAREVFLLDPTLNQRKDFHEFLKVLSKGNPRRQFSYFGELRGEGVTEETARLLREANFTEVEVGLQSIDPDAQRQMDRKNNLRAFERGVRAMLGQGIRVKVDLIVGLPGDTVDSVRRGLHYLRDQSLFSDLQVFNLSVLPGTAFREEAEHLGLAYQPRPPYYVLRTPTLERGELFQLMHEAQQMFDIEFDAAPPPVLSFDTNSRYERVSIWDLDSNHRPKSPADCRAQAFTLWLRSNRFDRHEAAIVRSLDDILRDNPFSTLQVVFEPQAESQPAVETMLTHEFMEVVQAACLRRPTYLDRYYALQPGRANGAKRLIVLLSSVWSEACSSTWREEVGAIATLVWRETSVNAAGLPAHEYHWADNEHLHSASEAARSSTH